MAREPRTLAGAGRVKAEAPPPPSPISAEGHRARMRSRLLSAGPDSVADHELLEMILFLALQRRIVTGLQGAVKG